MVGEKKGHEGRTEAKPVGPSADRQADHKAPLAPSPGAFVSGFLKHHGILLVQANFSHTISSIASRNSSHNAVGAWKTKRGHYVFSDRDQPLSGE